MSVTLSYIPKRKQTVEYPEDPVTVQPRYRGQHLLHVDELAGKNVRLFSLRRACPSECIYIEAPTIHGCSRAHRVDERYAKVYNIDYNRCIFCGFASKLVRRCHHATVTTLNFPFTTGQIF